MQVRNLIGLAFLFCAGCSTAVPGSQDDDGSNTSGVSAAGKAHWRQDQLCVGDAVDEDVKCFNASTGELERTLANSLTGPWAPGGLFFRGGEELVLVKQNQFPPVASEVLAFNDDGVFLGPIVSKVNPKVPFLGRGTLLRDGEIYVADMGDPNYTLGAGAPPNPFPARVAVFDAYTGQWLRDLAYEGFAQTCTSGADPVCEQWSPRGIVFGPDGALYVAVMHFVSNANPNTLPGRIIRFPAQGAPSVFVDGATCDCGLARPEGIAFGPGNRLYATSFRVSVADNDKILVFGLDGAYLDKIDLDVAGQARAFAQAIVFGPQNKLFVPITGNGPDTGSVRSYNVHSKKYDVLVPPGTLAEAWYAAFTKTNPTTLAYGTD